MNKTNETITPADVHSLRLYTEHLIDKVYGGSIFDHCVSDEDYEDTKFHIKRGKALYQAGYEVIFSHRYDGTIHTAGHKYDQKVEDIAVAANWIYAGHFALAQQVRRVYIVKRKDVPKAHQRGFGSSLNNLRRARLNPFGY